MNSRWLTRAIVFAIVGGIVVGWLCNVFADDGQRQTLASALSLVTDLFLRLIKMVIAPLVFTTLVLGVAKMENAAAIGRMTAKTLGWFFIASLISLMLGTVLADIMRPGAALHLHPEAVAATAMHASAFDLKTFLTHLVPQSIVRAMADNEILQIVIFALFFGMAALSLKSRVAGILKVVEDVALIMLKVTEYVMLTAPVAVFAAMASTIALQGPSVLLTLAEFVGGFYVALLLLSGLLCVVGFLLVRDRLGRLLAMIREPLLIAFATASSEAAYPKLLLQIERFGVPNHIASFVLPLGYSFNMDGAMMYCTFAVLFIAQAYGIELSWADKLPMLAILMVSTKGLAGVPRASLAVLTSTLHYFNLPEAGLVLILAVDHLLDMGRTGINVLGNTVATCAVARWENQLGPEQVPSVSASDNSRTVELLES
jgi:Na+/H+-dicarboxylate symporter